MAEGAWGSANNLAFWRHKYSNLPDRDNDSDHTFLLANARLQYDKWIRYLETLDVKPAQRGWEVEEGPFSEEFYIDYCFDMEESVICNIGPLKDFELALWRWQTYRARHPEARAMTPRLTIGTPFGANYSHPGAAPPLSEAQAIATRVPTPEATRVSTPDPLDRPAKRRKVDVPLFHRNVTDWLLPRGRQGASSMLEK